MKSIREWLDSRGEPPTLAELKAEREKKVEKPPLKAVAIGESDRSLDREIDERGAEENEEMDLENTEEGAGKKWIDSEENERGKIRPIEYARGLETDEIASEDWLSAEQNEKGTGKSLVSRVGKALNTGGKFAAKAGRATLGTIKRGGKATINKLEKISGDAEAREEREKELVRRVELVRKKGGELAVKAGRATLETGKRMGVAVKEKGKEILKNREERTHSEPFQLEMQREKKELRETLDGLGTSIFASLTATCLRVPESVYKNGVRAYYKEDYTAGDYGKDVFKVLFGPEGAGHNILRVIGNALYLSIVKVPKIGLKKLFAYRENTSAEELAQALVKKPEKPKGLPVAPLPWGIEKLEMQQEKKKRLEAEAMERKKILEAETVRMHAGFEVGQAVKFKSDNEDGKEEILSGTIINFDKKDGSIAIVEVTSPPSKWLKRTKTIQYEVSVGDFEKQNHKKEVQKDRPETPQAPGGKQKRRNEKAPRAVQKVLDGFSLYPISIEQRKFQSGQDVSIINKSYPDLPDELSGRIVGYSQDGLNLIISVAGKDTLIEEFPITDIEK